MPRAILLAAAVCMDTFFAAMGCSISGIRIPKRCAALISAVGTAFLGMSLLLAQVLGAILPEIMLRYAGAVILFLIGGVQIMKEALRSWFRAHPPELQWKTLGLVISICIDETCADADGSKVLSLQEAAAFSAALSLDSLASGLGAGLQMGAVLPCLMLTLILGFVLTVLGGRIGRRCSGVLPGEWLGGGMLLLLGVMRLASA